MFVRPDIDPIAFSLGPFSVHWYGLSYLAGFIIGFLIAKKNAHRLGINAKTCEDLLFYTGIGVIAGGRIGYVLFYQTAEFLSNPLFIFKIWEGGMSFHGGLIGVLIAIFYISKRLNKTFLEVGDFMAPLIPIGLGCGRIGNFINNELWGKVSDLPWAIAPLPGLEARHPSQLYEAFLEGFVLFLIVHFVYKTQRNPGTTSGAFLLFYGLFRFIVEWVRIPDPQLGYLAWGWLTMGQVLTFPMMIAGSLLLHYSRLNAFGSKPSKRKTSQPNLRKHP